MTERNATGQFVSGGQQQRADLPLHLWEKQGDAFESKATEIFYGGAAGGGKSHLMRIVAVVWAMEIPGLQIYLFRRVYEDLLKNHLEGPKGFRQMLAPLTNDGWVQIVDDQIRFWNGARIYLCHCQHNQDVYRYQGAEMHVLLIDELTHFEEPTYRFLRQRTRMVGLNVPEKYLGLFPRILCCGNPGGVGHLWVKNTFIINCEPMQIRSMPSSEGGMWRQFIPARLEDNPSMQADDPGYEARLEGLGSRELVAAMRWGDWDVVEGAFFDCFDRRKHVLTPFAIPYHWLRFRSMDWGSASPFSIGWWAVVQDDYDLAEGLDGNGKRTALGDRRMLPRGALVRYREDYGDRLGADGKGLKLTAEAVADRIVELERKDPKLSYAVLDPSTFKQDGGPSIAERMNKVLLTAGIAPFRKADNARVRAIQNRDRRGPMSGLDALRARMIGVDGVPLIYCFSTCFDSIRTIPILQHDPQKAEDIDYRAEDHCFTGDTLVRTDNGLYSFVALLGRQGRVRSHDGKWHDFRSVRRTRQAVSVVRLAFSDGTTIRCTPDHRFLTASGEVEARHLAGVAILSLSAQPYSNGMAGDIISAGSATIAALEGFFIDWFGAHITVRLQKAGMFITRIATAITTRSPISLACRLLRINLESMVPSMVLAGTSPSSGQLPRHRSGMPVLPGRSGIGSIISSIASRFFTANERLSVFIAGKKRLSGSITENSARMPVNLPFEGPQELMTSSGHVLFALWNLPAIDIRSKKYARAIARVFPALAPGPVCYSVKAAGVSDVYCFTVPDTGTFELANGMVAFQCADDWRYAVLSRPWLKDKPALAPPKDAYRTAFDDLINDSIKLL